MKPEDTNKHFIAPIKLFIINLMQLPAVMSMKLFCQQFVEMSAVLFTKWEISVSAEIHVISDSSWAAHYHGFNDLTSFLLSGLC